VVYVEIVIDLLHHVISPQVSGNENVAIRRGIAFEIMRGFTEASASAIAKKYAKVLPRDLHSLLENLSQQNPLIDLARSIVAQVKQRLATELDRETAEKVAKVFEEMFMQVASSTPADVLPAEERVKYYKIGWSMGIIAIALDSVPGPSPSRI
jgi:hypothetical protein